MCYHQLQRLIMSRQHLIILQLEDLADPSQLLKSYHASRARYERLTARGPLRYYRRQLLADLERAYQALKSSPSNKPAENQPPPHRNGICPTYVAARRTARLSNYLKDQIPGKSPRLNKNPSGLGPLLPLPGRTLNYWRHQNAARQNSPRQDLIEDEFCREVIYRLEGDLIRFDSRRALLQYAHERGIHTFRANMLIAQIVEAVRRNKLYEPSPAEKSALKPSKARLNNKKVKPRPSRTKLKRRWGPQPLLAAVILFLVVVIDLLLIRLLDG